MIVDIATITMWHNANMPAKAVQISLDADLLRRIDADAEARERGRSAFVRTAVERYLAAKQRRHIESRIAEAYTGRADELLAEATPLIDNQAWPDD